jgi:hypothetical protein
MRRKKERDRQIERALLALGPPIQTHIAVNSENRKRSIATIIELLKLPRDEEWEFQNDISDRVDLMLYIRHRVGDQEETQTRKNVVDEYVAWFQSLRIVTRKVIAVGECPLIAEDAADYLAEIAKSSIS